MGEIWCNLVEVRVLVVGRLVLGVGVVVVGRMMLWCKLVMESVLVLGRWVYGCARCGG